MSDRLAPYGDIENGLTLTKVGGGKSGTPRSLAERMPTLDIASKVGLPPMPTKMPTPGSLVARMPSADVAAKVGADKKVKRSPVRVVRKNALS